MSNLKQALNCDRSVFIQACAGAGKTFALTKRYAAILDRFAQEAAEGAPKELTDHKKILVITFTKKAAGEMTDRIYKDVNILLSGEKPEGMEKMEFCPILRRNDASVHAFTENLRDTFSQNSISTIDSFCAGILREFAHKIDLDPQFIAQDDAESKKLLDESLEKWLRKKVADDQHIFDLLLKDMNFFQIRQALKKLYHSREILDGYTDHFYDKNDAEIWQDWLMRYTPAADIEMLIIRFESIWQYAQEKCLKQSDNLYQLLKDMHDDLEHIRSIEDPMEFRAAFLSEVVNRKKGFIKDDGDYRKDSPGNKSNWNEGKDFINDWLILLHQIEPNEILQTPGPQDKKIIPLLRELITQFKEFDGYYFDIRKKRNVLDFSDIIIETHRLITQDADVRKHLGKRYRHFMLDEFQDTNPLRWDIVRSIFESSDHAKLFIVGDRKQSIYRFNNADVTVMNVAEDLVKELDGKILDFNDNYRSSEEFVDKSINDLVKTIMPSDKEKREAYEASFEPTQAKIPKKNISPALEMHWCTEPEDKGDDNISALHAARQVKRLLEEYQNTEIDEEGKPLIGVLLRKFTNITDYLQAFSQLDIPISIIGGKGFYETPAVRDIFHFLSVMDNPYDDHALTGLLRSPFIALSDPDINLLCKREKYTPLFEAMDDHRELHEAKKTILSWMQAACRMPLDELLGKILDSNDRELGYVSELLPEQQLSNLDKAINIIRGMQRSGSSLRNIREFFAYQMTQKTNEAQAVYPGTAKVHLLTVHKAKGLEFPIVVLPEMNSKGNTSKDSIRFGRTGNAAEIALSLSDQDKPGLLLRLKEIADKEEDAEEKRLFYVALTRAIYKVCLLGEGKKSTANTWWNKYVLKPHGLEENKEPENWPEDIIKQHSYEEMIFNTKPTKQKTLNWNEAAKFESPGSYLYRSPHDLMGEEKKFDLSENKAGLGTAPGSLYHACIEQNWVDIAANKKEIDDYIHDHFIDVDRIDLINKVEKLLEITRKHPVYDILSNSSIEQYRELSLKAWLKRDLDVVQVNGTIDLLYKDDEQWVILDFKTDSNKSRLEAYKKQIRSYQWMLKQAYGIDASGKIFFVSLNETIDVVWDDDYFDDLPIGKGYKPALPLTHFDIFPLISKIKQGNQLLFCTSAHHEEQIFLALVKAGCMRPDIKITTLSKWIKSYHVESTSQDRLRLMIQRSKENVKAGSADFLAKAIRDQEVKKGELRNEFRDDYLKILQNKNYRPANLPYLNRAMQAQQIIFIDLPPLAPLEKELIDDLKTQVTCVDCTLSPKAGDCKFIHIEAFSPREEVLAVAKHIVDTAKQDDDILITVSSMEKYAPHLQRLFPQMGLSVRFTGPRSLLESPYTTLLLGMLNICALTYPEWQDLAPILLHPLMEPRVELMIHDKKLRAKPWEERVLPESANEFLSKYYCKNPQDLFEKISAFIKDLKIASASEDEKICHKFMETLTAVLQDMTAIFGDHSISMIYQEMKTRIQKESVPRRDQANGIPVVGFLDSLGSQPDKLYVMGMVEGDIPRPENENPCLIRKEKFSLDLNHHFMSYWTSLGERVVFSSSKRAEDGAEQNRSSFLENLKPKYIHVVPEERRSRLLNFEANEIKDKSGSLIQRHNEIVSGKRNKYSGLINEEKREFNLSVTSIDTLLACPMRFYLDKILKISPTDEDEGKYWIMKKGSVIHKVMEFFANEGGFSLPLTETLALLKKNIDVAFVEENIDPDDPFQMDHFRNYIRDLNLDSETNALVKILKDIKKDFEDYDHIISEKAFNDLQLLYGDVTVSLSGRIDKIMLNEIEKQLVASDYKTGVVKTQRLKLMLLSQLYLYLKKCKEDYSDYELMAIYEQIKDAKDTKIIKFIEEGGSFVQKGSKTGNGFIIDEFENHLSDLFAQISEGKYYITSKPYKEACEYCPHEGLCRKDSRLKIKEN
ncbi:MAG: UvrD-helicase domain-containing protein [Candidatus Marinimicrobia bacterium]|nr:UvrD-helicase domain-containing protein [Candidatus Neomarinimicrobiota bacterium]